MRLPNANRRDAAERHLRLSALRASVHRQAESMYLLVIYKDCDVSTLLINLVRIPGHVNNRSGVM
jgi:hypothetical protein